MAFRRKGRSDKSQAVKKVKNSDGVVTFGRGGVIAGYIREMRWPKWTFYGMMTTCAVVTVLAVMLSQNVFDLRDLVDSWGKKRTDAVMMSSLTTQAINDALILDSPDGNYLELGGAKARLEKTMAQRKKYAVTLMKESPRDFLENAISSDLNDQLFWRVEDVEQEMTIEGKVEVLCVTGGEEGEDAEVEGYDTYQVVAGDGEVYSLYAPDEDLLEDLNTGDTVRVKGYGLDGNFVVDTLSDSANFEVKAKAAATQLAPNVVNRKVAVVMMSDAATPRSGMLTKDMYLTIMKPLRDYFEEVSFGQMTISGKDNPNDPADIVGYYQMPKLSSCDYSAEGWEAKAKAAATAGGFNATGYSHVMYMMPPIGSSLTNGCWINGFAYYNSAVSIFNTYKMMSTTYLNDPVKFAQPNPLLQAMGVTMPYGAGMIIDTLSHELGHNFGFGHAKTVDCFDEGKTKWVQISNNCRDPYEYGDAFDTMGSGKGYPSHYGAYNKYMNNWIPATRVTKVTTNGTYDIYPLEFAGTGSQLLHVPITYSGTNGSNTTFNYYLDYKTPHGFNIYPNSRGVLVRSAVSKTGGTTGYNADPSSCNGDARMVPGTSMCTSSNNKPLQEGLTFVDPIRKVSFNLVSMDDIKATVEVKFGDSTIAPCVRREATYAVDPIVGAANAGSVLEYKVSVMNNDSTECGVSIWGVKSIDLPTGFTSSHTGAQIGNITVSPGTTATFYAPKITSPRTAAAGDYPINFEVVNQRDASAQIVSATYRVNGTVSVCTRNNPTVSITPTTQTGMPGAELAYTVSVKNNDTSTCAGSSFDISTALPSGFSVDTNNVTTSINPGATYTRVMKVSSSTTAKDGNYTVPFTVKNTTLNTTSSVSVVYVVKAPAPTCTRKDATVSVTPSSLSGTAGQKLDYTVKITNNDSTECTSSNYSISATLPSGFSAEGNNAVTSIVPGGTYSGVVGVKSGASAAAGNFTIQFAIKNTTVGTTTNKSVTYVVTASCVRSNPTVTIAPTTQTGTPGVELTYTLTVKNNDTTACASSNYSIAVTLPNGFSVDSNNISTPIAPGVTYSTKVKVKSNTTVGNGSYTLPFAVKNTTLNTTSNVSATYVVTGGTVCVRKNPTISVVPTAATGERNKTMGYTLTITNNDSGCTSNSYAVTATVPSNFSVDKKNISATLAPGASGSYVLNVTPGNTVGNGVYSLSISITEGANKYSAGATYNVINPTGGSSVPPVVEISGLKDGATIPNGNNKLVVKGTHADGIKTIIIYLNDVKVQTCENPKKNECDYSIQGNKINAGQYVLKAEVIANDSAKTMNTMSISLKR